jgi:hypothetical protein
MAIDRRTFIAAAGFSLSAAAVAAETAGAAPAAEKIPQIGLRYAFSVSIFFNERIRINSRNGRAFVPAVGGEIWGPRLQGRVVPYGGADYASGGALDAHYMLQATDGTLIYINNRGFMKRLGGGPPVVAPRPPRQPGQPPDQRMQGGAGADVPLRMRLTPTFDAPQGPHEWMSRTLFVGHGGRYMNPDHTIFTYYEVL